MLDNLIQLVTSKPPGLAHIKLGSCCFKNIWFGFLITILAKNEDTSDIPPQTTCQSGMSKSGVVSGWEDGRRKKRHESTRTWTNYCCI